MVTGWHPISCSFTRTTSGRSRRTARSSRQLTSTKDIQEGLPSYSADGKSICFVSNEAHKQGETGSYNVFVMNADGSSKTQVTELSCWNSWPLLTNEGLSFLSGRANDPAAQEKYTRVWGVSKTDWLH